MNKVSTKAEYKKWLFKTDPQIPNYKLPHVVKILEEDPTRLGRANTAKCSGQVEHHDANDLRAPHGFLNLAQAQAFVGLGTAVRTAIAESAMDFIMADGAMSLVAMLRALSTRRGTETSAEQT